MATAVESLFGITPEGLQAQRENALQARALQFAQLDPIQQAQMGLYAAGNRLGGGLGGLLGAQDPEMARVTALQQVSKQIDPTSPESLLKGAQMLVNQGLGQQAIPLVQKAQELKMSQAQAAKAAAETRKVDLSVQQEENLREELAKLPANASQEQLLSVLQKYGSPDKVLSALQTSIDRKGQQETQLQVARERIEAQIQTARERNDALIQQARLQGANSQTLARLQADNAQALELLRQEGRLQLADVKSKATGGAKLAPSLQKEESTDLATIDNLEAQANALKPSIEALTPKEGKAPALELGPLNNTKYLALNAAGRSTPESRAYASLKSAVDTAVNLQVSAEKGVQTDKDVLRFANALISAYGRNDTKATLEALNKFQSSVETAKEKTKVRLDSRRKSQGVEPYFGTNNQGQGTAENPIVLK